MNILKIKTIDGCLEGSNVRDILFDCEIDKKFIDYLGNLGKFIYNDNFEKPLFRVIVKGKYTIKGSLGNKAIRILLPDNENGEMLNEITGYIKKFNPSELHEYFIV